MPWRLFTLALIVGCADEEEPDGCTSFPETATPTGRVLDNSDDCGHWEVPTGEHVYINVVITTAEARCEGTADGAVTIPYDPIFSDLSNEDPKWTFDVQGVSEGEGSLDVSCDDGTTFEARFTVI